MKGEHEEEAAVGDHAHRQGQQCTRQTRAANDVQVEQRSPAIGLDPSLGEDEQHGEHGAGCDGDIGPGRPALLAAEHQWEHDQQNCRGSGHQTDQVQAVPHAADNRLVLGQPSRRQDDGEDADGNVDEED